MSQNKEKIKELAETINLARKDYYNDEPVLSDEEYDNLIDELFELDPENPAITNIGANVNSEWEKVKLAHPMGSLNKAKNPDELKKWINDCFTSDNSIFITEKLDGLSVGLTYEDGKLIEAYSRGSGVIGENITRNVVRMRGVKKTLPNNFTGFLRGEIVLTHENHKTYFADKANPRNAASGTTKRLDGVGCEYLNVIYYQVITNSANLTSEFFQFKFIENDLKLSVPYYEAFAGKNKTELLNFAVNKWEEYHNKRSNLTYDLDGLVCKINDLKAQKALGETHLRPKGAIAFKFKPERAKTKIKNIIIQVGNSGRLTPVAEIEPVMLMGAEVKRATLHNFDYINKLKIDIGAEVYAYRANDVIPKIDQVIISTKTIFEEPTKCPECGGNVEWIGKNLQCMDTDICPAQIEGKIKNWLNTLNILEIGETLVHKLVEAGKVSTIEDLYKLSVKDLAVIDRMGEKSATNCYKSLWSHNPVPLDQFLGGLSIPLVGKSTIEILIKAGMDNLEKIINASAKNFLNIKGMGERKSEFLFYGLRRNKQTIEKLLKLGVKIMSKEEVKVGKLSNLSFVFTGEMINKRKTLEQMVADNGGTVKSGVNKTLSYLVLADDTTVKAAKARDLGVKTISEKMFLEMVDG